MFVGSRQSPTTNIWWIIIKTKRESHLQSYIGNGFSSLLALPTMANNMAERIHRVFWMTECAVVTRENAKVLWLFLKMLAVHLVRFASNLATIGTCHRSHMEGVLVVFRLLCGQRDRLHWCLDTAYRPKNKTPKSDNQTTIRHFVWNDVENAILRVRSSEINQSFFHWHQNMCQNMQVSECYCS